MDLETYQSVDTEIWSGETFGVIQNCTAAIFEILIFTIFQGVKVQNSVKMAKI